MCGLNNVCCTADRKVCGQTCCEVGQDCVLGTCAAAGSVACGNTICASTQTCVTGVCCNAGETACGGRCCPAGNTCLSVSRDPRSCWLGFEPGVLGVGIEEPVDAQQLSALASDCCPTHGCACNTADLCACCGFFSAVQNQFCAPIGSSLCGNGQICNAPQTCAGGLLCCDAGASFCGGACCPGKAAAHHSMRPSPCGNTSVCKALHVSQLLRSCVLHCTASCYLRRHQPVSAEPVPCAWSSHVRRNSVWRGSDLPGWHSLLRLHCHLL
jgi:hypothetical protein